MKRDIDYYLTLFRNLDNPVYYSIIFVVLLYFLLIVIHKYLILPLKKKHLLERKELESENLKMLETFAEYDPNPIIRIDESGDIMDLNKAARKLFNISPVNHINIRDFFPEININFKEEISKNSKLQLNAAFRERHLLINFFGISFLRRAQIYFLDVTERTNQELMTKESEKKFRSLSFYLQDYLETERQRIGLELHDVIGQNLFLLKLKFDEASKNFNDFKENSNSIVNSLDSTINELRNIMFDLKPRNLDDFGLDYAVEKLSDHISKSSKQNGIVDIIGKSKRLDNEVELHMFRIIQECLTNIIRHSKATEYKIQLWYSESSLKVYISDNGVGFDIDKVDKNKNFGLFNMSERIKALNGKLTVNSSSEGTLLLFEIPI
ncbi:MAG: histidine kinase [Ignavibacteriaceae bacterium]|nr:histidine kinase [Ignavibacteriaceae bacterium]